jgi:hypothetical protein
MEETIEKNDIPVENKPHIHIRTESSTEYPFNLTEDEIIRLIYFFGARKCKQKAAPHKRKNEGGTLPEGLSSMGSTDVTLLKEMFGWFGIVYRDETEFAAGYRQLILSFKAICGFLRKRPAFITTDIRNALKTGGYDTVLRNVVMVMNENREFVPRLVAADNKRNIIPLGKMEMQMWDFQNTLSDKMKLIIDSITLKDIQHANLGIKSKALRDLYSVMHMARMGTKNPNMTLVNVNVNADGVKAKMQAVTNYVIKNRENNNG